MKPIRNGTIHKTSLARIAMVCAVFVWNMADVAQAVDSDGDGMPDEWEILFSLNTNYNDSAEDPDKDLLSNLMEYQVLTDPHAPDTDRDGWTDGGGDSNPVSRAYIKFGDPQFTVDDIYSYCAPDWALNVYRIGGAWMTNPVCWHVPPGETAAVGSLNVDLDRSILTTNNLRYALTFWGHTNASLYVDLIDANETVVATNLFNNLNYYGSNVETTVILNIPLATYTNAAVIHLRRGIGESTVFSGLLYIDEDGDFLDADQERQIGTSDYNADSDGDGLSDWDEVFVYGTNPANADTDGDGMRDGWEVLHGLNPKVNDAGGDLDGDGVDNLTEYKQGRDPAVGAVADTTGVVNLRVYTTLE